MEGQRVPEKDDGIEHVVLLLLENHSFDQMLGALQEVYPDLEGVTPATAATRVNLTLEGRSIWQRETRERQMIFDPKHEHLNVMAQLEDGNGGFVREFQKAYPKCSADQLQDVMGYYPLDFLPALHALARNYTICDYWFSSLPGPTWPNRFFALTGTCSGQVLMPDGLEALKLHWYTEQDQPTIFTRLNEAGKTWRIFHYDFPSSLVLAKQRQAECLCNYESVDRFFDRAAGPEQDFPAFSFIEPQYFGVGQNDDHPPHNVMKAEKLIADVYNALRSNHELWAKTLLVVTYDEHGGFYDHVVPPRAEPPDRKTNSWSFNQLGVRVPALLISQKCGPSVNKTCFDHTSLLKYLQGKWGLGDLGLRTTSAASISCAINPTGSNWTLPYIRVPNEVLVSENLDAERDDDNGHQRAIHALAEFVQAEVDNAERVGVDLAADIAWTVKGWRAFKHRLGRTLCACGDWLSRDHRQARERRRQRTRNALERLKAARVSAAPTRS
jgi:phospholipase C